MSAEIAWVQRRDGVLLPIKVQANAGRNAVTGVHGGRLKLAVSAPPEKGKANRAVLELLAELLEVRPNRLFLLRGLTSSEKAVLIADATLEQVCDRIRKVLGSYGAG